jgi:hypothetical protein
MADKRITAYEIATIVAAVLAVAGVWLPWVRKLPVGYTDGQPYYTSEYVWGSEPGISGLDPALMFLVVAVVTVFMLTPRRTWHLNIILVITGGLLLYVSGTFFYQYWSGEQYAVEPGLYLLLVSGLLFVLVGTRAIFKAVTH